MACCEKMFCRKDLVLLLVGVCVGTCLTFIYSLTIPMLKNENMDENFIFRHIQKQPTVFKCERRQCNDSLTPLIQLAHEINTANVHVRGTKTGQALHKAAHIVNDLLHLINTTYNEVTARKVVSSTSVCPEVYKGLKYGYPFYKVGFLSENCTFGKPLDTLVTLLLVFKEENISSIESLISSVTSFSKKIKFKINIPTGIKASAKHLCAENKSCLISFMKDSEGNIWNKMAQDVQTPYVLIGRDITWFNNDSRLERLIRQIERLDVPVAGGSYRNASGHWFIGCQQSVLRNYTLVYEAGYDESKEECLFCDHIDGPFVIKTEIFKETSLRSNITGEGLFEDFFLRINNKEKVVCPDSMFFTKNLERSMISQKWADFVSVWKIKKISFSGASIEFACETSYECIKNKNTALHPCCQLELADLLKVFFQACDSQKMLCELDSGSVMGAVKFHSILPWEKDGDTVFLSYNFTALKSTSSLFSKYGYKLEAQDNRKYNKNSVSGGFFYAKSKHWYIEVWGMPHLGTEEEIKASHPQTKINVNGHWVGMLRNPALYARNRYGREIFQHAQHWSETGLSDSWHQPKTNHFNPCKVPRHQSCLDSYNADGNLQFRDPIP